MCNNCCLKSVSASVLRVPTSEPISKAMRGQVLPNLIPLLALLFDWVVSAREGACRVDQQETTLWFPLPFYTCVDITSLAVSSMAGSFEYLCLWRCMWKLGVVGSLTWTIGFHGKFGPWSTWEEPSFPSVQLRYFDVSWKRFAESHFPCIPGLSAEKSPHHICLLACSVIHCLGTSTLTHVCLVQSG